MRTGTVTLSGKAADSQNVVSAKGKSKKWASAFWCGMDGGLTRQTVVSGRLHRLFFPEARIKKRAIFTSPNVLA